MPPPFIEDTAGNVVKTFLPSSLETIVDKAGGAAQMATGMTTVTKLNTRLAWDGNQPQTVTLNLQLYALENAKTEVEDAIKALEVMASPEIHDAMPMGRHPGIVMVNIGRNFMLTDCVIAGVTVPMDGPRTAEGYLTEAMVGVHLSSLYTPSRSDIAGGSAS